MKSNRKYAINSMRHPKIKNSTEGHVSTILAAQLTSRPMAWSEEYSDTVIGQLRGDAVSGDNVRSYYVEDILEKKSYTHTRVIQSRKHEMERKTRKCNLPGGGNKYILLGLENAKYRFLRNYLGNRFDHWN